MSAAHKSLPDPEVTLRQSWGGEEEMDPERFTSQMLKFPGPCVFFPSTWDLHFLLTGKGRWDNRGPRAGAPAAGKVRAARMPWHSPGQATEEQTQARAEPPLHTAARCGLLVPSPALPLPGWRSTLILVTVKGLLNQGREVRPAIHPSLALERGQEGDGGTPAALPP